METRKSEPSLSGSMACGLSMQIKEKAILLPSARPALVVPPNWRYEMWNVVWGAVMFLAAVTFFAILIDLIMTVVLE